MKGTEGNGCRIRLDLNPHVVFGEYALTMTPQGWALNHDTNVRIMVVTPQKREHEIKMDFYFSNSHFWCFNSQLISLSKYIKLLPF